MRKIEQLCITIRSITESDVDRWNLFPDIDLSEVQYEHHVAVDKEGNLLGFASLYPKDAALWNLWIYPDFRRQGIATQLINSFDIVPKRLSVKEDNQPAKSLYTKLGFVRKIADENYRHWNCEGYEYWEKMR